MDKFLVKGGIPLHGTVSVGGAKNVALKAFVASLLTEEEVIIHNVPIIRDVFSMLDVVRSLGVNVDIKDHTVRIHNNHMDQMTVPLDVGARLRTSSLVLGPLLARYGEANIPNPGGCRIGARPIDRHIEGLKQMGAVISYNSDDGYFHATANKLHGTTFSFSKNTHTGTEALMLAAVLADGETVLENAAEEVEIDDLIRLLTSMGATIARMSPRTIKITGQKKLHGAEFTIMSDRNEEITFALAAAVTGGSITVQQSEIANLKAFTDVYTQAGMELSSVDTHTTRYTGKKNILPVDITTAPYPGFMTDWQAPFAVLMTQALGVSTIHETVFESRFSYVSELKKMGATIDFFDPEVNNPEVFYNFNWADKPEGYHQAIRISGPTDLHNAILTIDDLRAGATLVLAALCAKGESYIHEVEHLDRGYEQFEERLTSLGANITRIKEEL